MRNRLIMCAVAVLLGAGWAHYDGAKPPQANADFEIVIVESVGCTYCGLYRRDLKDAEAGAVRFLDIHGPSLAALSLVAPVDVVPTAIFMSAGREVGRLPGYVAPTDLQRAIDWLAP